MQLSTRRARLRPAENQPEDGNARHHAGRAARRSLLPTLVVGALVAGVFPAAPAEAAAPSVTSASFTSGGFVDGNGTRYAKEGQGLTLTVITSSDTKCVEVTGLGRQTSNSNKGQTSWAFSVTAPVGSGSQSFTATAGDVDNKGVCKLGTSTSSTSSASYFLDNAGPTLLPSNTDKTGVSPAPNAAGWNKTDVSIAWSATDGAGSGVGSGPTPSTDSVTANTTADGVVKTASAADRLGHSGSGSVTVKLDKTAPTITGSRTPTGNQHGWNNTDVTATFSCSDALSGLASACPGATFTSSGADQSVSRTVEDNAGNTNSATVGGIKIDKAAPTLTGTPAGTANPLGWRNTNVTVNWACADQANLSGINGSCPEASTISSEGSNVTDSASVSDKAGNTTVAASSPAVKIDKRPPTTSASALASWNNVDVAVQLTAGDNLSGVKSTHYKLDGGDPQAGTSVPTISAEGVHTLEYWSVDNADNEESHTTIQVKIDKTPPSITPAQSPGPNGAGWNNEAVTVTFTCGDGASGVASCTADGGTGRSRTVSTNGRHVVSGTAVDNAGNSAAGRADVAIDTITPTITAARDGVATNGWYKQDVVVGFTCNDALSGIVAGASGCTPNTTVGQGRDQSVTGTATDAAGNIFSVTEGGINVDKTAPELSGAATTAPVNGWYRGNVTIRWNASDLLSGLAGDAPLDDVLTGDGPEVCAAKTVTDVAGNSTTKTVCVAIDGTPPTTSASVPNPLESGWYAGAVRVTLTALDPMSRVAATYYSVGTNGAAQLYNGPFDFGQRGIHTLRFWSVDTAGNVENNSAPSQSITLKIDGIAPTITGSRSPAANDFGWNNGPVTVSFRCSDAESGIGSCTEPVPVGNEGANPSVTGTAVDIAGNSASATVGGINIDTMPPTLDGAPTTPATAGWYRGDVAIAWRGSDGLSGIDPATQPDNGLITGEGSNLGAGPVTIADKAGNIGSASVSGIKIDRNGPSITPVRPAASGWYNGVTIGFDCVDPALADGTAGSGVASCPNDKQVLGNGANQSVTSDPATDIAGNTTAGVTLGGINVDGLAPQSSANNSCTGKNNFCKGTATVNIAATDQAGLSGVKEIHYTVNGQNERVMAGSTATVQVTLNGSGEANVAYWAVDNAGNAERPNGIALKYDNIAPTVTNTITPPANGAGWHKADATVAFTATDDDGGSGVDLSTVPAPQTLTAETAGTAVSATIEDMAGNVTTDSVTVRIDRTAPTITGSVVSGTPGANGWYTGPVTVRFTCADPNAGNGVTGSGLAAGACPDDVTLSANGAGQSVIASVSDRAGNTASATVSGINIDTEKPTVSVGGVAGGAVSTLGAVPQATCTGSDTVSTLASCTVSSPTGGQPNGVGTWAVTATATDVAGNISTASVTYKVVYKFSGFSQPVNDPRVDSTLKPSVFKAGSTVPVKFRLRKADDSVVQTNTNFLPAWTTPQKGAAIAAPISEDLYSEPATSGSTYRWDSADQQYIFNYGTAKSQGGSNWRIGVRLDDGNAYTVDIGLRS